MKKLCKWSFVGVILATMFAAAPRVQAAETEEQLIAELSGPNEDKVASAMLHLEKEFPTSTNAFPMMKKLLADPREKVRRKAARVLGVLHAEVDDTDLKNICTLLKGADSREQIDGLIALRGLKASSTVPQITPLLKSPTPNVIRDACRTLAVLGTKDNIPDIEPLLNHPDAKVKKDAADALAVLRAKS